MVLREFFRLSFHLCLGQQQPRVSSNIVVAYVFVFVEALAGTIVVDKKRCPRPPVAMKLSSLSALHVCISGNTAWWGADYYYYYY